MQLLVSHVGIVMYYLAYFSGKGSTAREEGLGMRLCVWGGGGGGGTCARPGYMCFMCKARVHVQGQGTCASCARPGYMCFMCKARVHVLHVQGQGTGASCARPGYMCFMCKARVQVLHVQGQGTCASTSFHNIPVISDGLRNFSLSMSGSVDDGTFSTTI